ncbi:MAG: hypothetical protein HPY66_0581 [Firmicutes bacterium]|nr:hypothetical protein [Bacillota bacterium]
MPQGFSQPAAIRYQSMRETNASGISPQAEVVNANTKYY